MSLQSVPSLPLHAGLSIEWPIGGYILQFLTSTPSTNIPPLPSRREPTQITLLFIITPHQSKTCPSTQHPKHQHLQDSCPFNPHRLFPPRQFAPLNLHPFRNNSSIRSSADDSTPNKVCFEHSAEISKHHPLSFQIIRRSQSRTRMEVRDCEMGVPA